MEVELKGNGLPVPLWITGSGQRADKKQVESRIEEHNGICIIYSPEVPIEVPGVWREDEP